MQWCSRGRELERSIEHRALMIAGRRPLPLQTGPKGGVIFSDAGTTYLSKFRASVRYAYFESRSKSAEVCLGCLGVMLAQNQGSATVNPPGVAGYAGGIRGPSPGADVEARACRSAG